MTDRSGVSDPLLDAELSAPFARTKDALEARAATQRDTPNTRAPGDRAPATDAVFVQMIKKRLKTGEPCRKCAQAQEMLERRELWEEIDEVVLADEADPSSEGMLLAEKYQVAVAPFFLVRTGADVRVFDSAIKVAKEVLTAKKERRRGELQELPQAPLAIDRAEVEQLASSLAGASPQRIIDAVLQRLGNRAVIAFSGAEDVALIDMAAKSGHEFSVFCLDTGRLHPETYRFIDTVRQFYGIELLVVSPHFVAVEAMVRKKGLFSFYEDGHTECCSIRKIEPLRRTLASYGGWITGQRRDQSPTRTDVPEVSWDEAHVAAGMLKANPLAGFTSEDVWRYIRDNDVPYNELHDRGFASIGCEPCTRARRPGEHERAARWWWEAETKRECGLHVDKD